MTPEEWAEHWEAQADVCWRQAVAADQAGDHWKAAELRRMAARAERLHHKYANQGART